MTLIDQAIALHRQGNLVEAEALYRKALDADAGNFDALHMLGIIRAQSGQYDEAEKLIGRAVSIDPTVVPCLHNYGTVFAKLKRYQDALNIYDRAVRLAPNYGPIYFDRGNALYGLQRYDKALASYTRAQSLMLGHKYLSGKLLHLKMLCCDWGQLDAVVESIEKDLQERAAPVEPFGYQAVANSARSFQRCVEIYTADKYPRSPAPLWRGEKYSHRKIRIGYVSGEFRAHVVCFLMAELFELHDKNRFELYAFDNGRDDGSDVRARINRAFDRVIEIGHLDDLQAASAIRKEEIDILVNLNGYFGDERTGVFSRKPAPVQVNYLGFTATIGADYIDYIIADAYVVPPQSRPFYTEKVVSLPDTYQANDTKRPLAALAPTRTQLGLPEAGFVFCCFCNTFKITPQIFDVWMRLLQGVDGSVLWLLENHPVSSQNLRREAKQRGIAPERLVFAPSIKYADYLSRYRAADLFLDTFPFNGGATASDALWAGLPVLTCSGEPFTARMAGSLLGAVDLPELITSSLADYEALALKLARDRALLASIREKLARNRDTCPLFKSERFTRHLEAAYQTMWERSQRGEQATSFAVELLPQYSTRTR
ncbi:MAG TPA: tetratricopeptide repeat protein [Xanthobacteraceae bacterium]|nr:tetratricopeptide repeat protein [Xanthobacteraceae bacterium]